MNKAIKATLAIAASSVAVVGSVVTPSLVSAWGDSNKGRPSYTIDQINNGELGDKIVFNSISDGPEGDEKNFVATRENTGVNAGVNNVWNGNEIKVENGKEYIIRLYVHNNNPGGLDAVATNTRVALSIPSETSKKVQVNGYISADNSDPKEYWDYVNFTADNAFHLQYVYGSALWTNKGIGANGGVKLSDEVATNASNGGVLVGYDKLDGNIPGCYEYSGYVTVRVKAVFDTDFYVDKQVRLEGTKEWSNHVNAKVGDRVEFQIEYKNTGKKGDLHENVMIRDVLPKNLRYVANTTRIWNINHTGDAVIPDGDIIGRGINIGSYDPGANAFIRFTAEVVDEDLACGSNTLVNWGRATVDNIVLQDYAGVVLNKVCENTETPVTPNTPNELPTTGPEAIAGGVIATGSVVTAAGYYIASRRSLH